MKIIEGHGTKTVDRNTGSISVYRAFLRKGTSLP
jgi:hypothetical protein